MENQETSQPRESHKPLTVSSEYVASIILWLQTFTGKSLSDSEMILWRNRLKSYPYWKLDKISEYTGGLNNNVFKFLDDVQWVEPKSAREDLGYTQLEDHNNLKSTRDMMQYAIHGLVKILTNDNPKKKDQISKWNKTLNS